MKPFFTLLLSISLSWSFAQSNNNLKTNIGKVRFFSYAPIENIEAYSKKISCIINPSNLQIAFIIPNKTFEFKKSLMQEHFNEKYMESDKYPKSTFSGKINEAIDLTKDGEYKVTTFGKLNIHGVEVERTIPGTIIVKNGKINLTSDFIVKVADHKIEIPTLMWEKIAEQIQVKIEVNFE